MGQSRLLANHVAALSLEGAVREALRWTDIGGKIISESKDKVRAWRGI